MIFRTAATTAALAVGLALVGAVAGPQWNPEPVAEHIEPAAKDTAIGGQVADEVAAVGTYDVRETDVTIQLDGTSVTAALREPEGADADRPGVVFVHGAGTGDAHGAFVDVATDLASAGVVTLVPSKRLDTYSTRHRDYVDMASDYAHSVEFLRDRTGVDPARVGVYGESEGTWIAPVMATEDPTIAFSVFVSAPVVPPREQAAFAIDAYLRNTDVPHGVFRAIPRAVGMVLPGGGFEYADFEVEPYLERLTTPVFVVYGTADPSMPVEQGARQVMDATAATGNDAVTVRYYAGANHGIRIDGEVVADFPRDLAAWIVSLPDSATAVPQIAGAAPNQQYLAAPVPSPRWFGNGDVVVGFVIAAGALLVLGPLVGAVAGAWRRTRHRDQPPSRLASGLRVPLAGLAIGAVATTVALVVYLVAVAQLALNYERDAWVVQGGWIAVRLVGIATLVAAAFIVNRVGDLRVARKASADPERVTTERVTTERSSMVHIAQGAPAYVTFWSIAAGATILVVTLAYWGVYQLGI